MTEKSRVLVFTTAYRPLVGGSEIALEEIVRRLPDIFFDILTTKHEPEFQRTENFGNGCIHRIGFGNPIDKLFFPVLGFIMALKFRPNLIHAYQASFGAGAAFIYKTFFPKARFILTLQEGKPLEGQSFVIEFFRRLMIRRADVITGISQYLVNYARKINPKAKFHLIPNGVDLDKFKYVSNSDDNTVITVSRLVPKNGVGDLIKAVAIVKKDISDIRLIVIGSGLLEKELRLEKELKQSVKDLGLEGHVIFTGFQSPESVAGYLAKAKVFARPSLSEGLGNAFLEAMAVGLPVIGTAVGGIPDFLRDGQTGLFCKVGDPQDLAEKIKILLTGRDLRMKLIDNGRRLVEENYDWKKIAIKFREIYESI